MRSLKVIFYNFDKSFSCYIASCITYVLTKLLLGHILTNLTFGNQTLIIRYLFV